jgi:DNA repair exonuclease SbcCD ATPase subunit
MPRARTGGNEILPSPDCRQGRSILETVNAATETIALFTRIEQQQERLAQTEDALRCQRMELAKAFAGLKSFCDTIGTQSRAETEWLARENDRLRALLAQENPDAAQASPPPMPEILHELQERVDLLEEQLREKESVIAEFQAQPPARVPSTDAELEDFEAELNEFRRHLEADRQALDDEREQLAARNVELQETLRQSELDLSRERAQLARERAQLDRLRVEIRQEIDRAQRDAGVREKLAPVRRLQDEMTEKHRLPESTPPAIEQRDPGSDVLRWRSLLARLSDSPA